MARKSLEKQIAELKFDAKIYAANQRRLLDQGRSLLQTLSPDEFTAMRHVSEGFGMLGVSLDEACKLAMHNRLPKAIQDQYRQIRSVFDRINKTDENDTDLRYFLSAVEDLYPRWKLDAWLCRCGEQKTLWHKTHFTFHDRNQIYCAACRTLAGWGSDRDFKAAKHKGEATSIVISHSLDIEAYTPPLMMPAKTHHRPYSACAKQSQKRPPLQNPIRAKRSQSRS